MSAPKLAFSSLPALSCAIPSLLSGPEADAVEQRLSQKIGLRARSIFEQSGNLAGKDEANWLQAESEILSGCEVRQAGTWVIVDAFIPNASAQDMEIVIRPARVIVRAHEIENARGSAPGTAEPAEHEPSELFLVANLPVEVDPASAAASFRDRQLHLMAKKRPPNKSTHASGVASNKVPSGDE
jgi:HSP20 family molecular chaperone IbpA